MEYIAEEIFKVVQTIQDVNGAPYFFKGHQSEVNVKLATMDKDKVRKHERYPAIILWMDIKEKIVDDYLQIPLNLSIVAPTLSQDFVEARLEEVIYPVLLPIYRDFMRAIDEAGLYFWDGALTYPPHGRTLAPYIGTRTTQRNRAFYLSDKLDAIEIENLTVNKLIDDCETISINPLQK